ncbi:hypothetical protein SNK03_004657 [Fusarium graminearum]|uniref:Chromosome 2, complete genome n=2 Tax=Gibberella zeae TaxID=5518 RepID=I1RVU2_GIBZE|nr:hypothetical protein FGSG_08387 [Fusarium graminearum PH-1]EYB27724.1 hypothetical protein FG05_08387 [Fusarium graminearum]ESU14965.1 hypothetical protein FGSG_08387 [Fusarium graminearum PH-1]KAI6753324.1 hypothetical protein HG531_005493 [Fusarium graminearum]PCD20666.1 hypothetical protein FGRA07_04818 [Fusarium graminearum]CAF3460541.1 unnamed protein product [Fusarium graminearum]|eukprot:XP_011320390.1 hypothetical protein FGSG_08387 [Fusarium graminearum PH-1]
MHWPTLIVFFAGSALAAPHLAKRQNPCFIVGSEALPEEVSSGAAGLASAVTCDTSRTTIDGVPDVISNGISFSSVNFAESGQSPLTFALDKFATSSPLANNDVNKFQNELNVYLATEAGIRAAGGNLAIKVPKFFLQFQIARIQQAQGAVSNIPGMTVDHQLEKVLKNAAGEDKSLLDQVNELAINLN